ncbi:cell division protein FtsX [Schleiferia thermophila]|jgi:cell division transport system permease protein|uniref:cell division protein FtsX n=1 Tax=Schleiferia thermophila TaxID=884107 RepID=UPI0004E7ABAF|nr:permease-like cell division protein FtsX [Schleiferia thermophila]KFD39340.1 cell division protein FtsX [Schleiferia thermophila str. Yellowstone]
MAGNYLKKRLRVNFISVVISQTLVLFVLGIFSILLLNARQIAINLKENLTLLVVLKQDVGTADARRLLKVFEADPRIRTAELITREEAAQTLKEELDEDFVEFLGYNPLSDVIEVKLQAQYTEPGEMEIVENYLKSDPIVDEVVIDKDLMYLMNANISKLSYLAVAVAVILLLVSIGLINSSIRLSIFSSRFIIRTMQLVGATYWFIIRPYILTAVVQGAVSGMLASGAIYLLYYYGRGWLTDLMIDISGLENLVIFPVLILLGMLISVLCTFFAMNKYLKLDIERLYL